MDPNDFGTVILDKFLPAEVIEGESLPGKTRYIVQNGTQIIQIDRIIDEEINETYQEVHYLGHMDLKFCDTELKNGVFLLFIFFL